MPQDIYRIPDGQADSVSPSILPPQSDYSALVEPQGNNNVPSVPNNGYGPPKADDQFNGLAEVQDNYNTPEQPQSSYDVPNQAANNNAGGYSTLYQLQNEFNSIQSDYNTQSSSGLTDYGAPKDGSLIDFSSAQRYETVDVTPLASPISTSTALDPASYGLPKQASILGANNQRDSSFGDSYAAPSQQTSEEIGVPQSPVNDYGVPRADSLIGSNQQFNGYGQQTSATNEQPSVAGVDYSAIENNLSNGDEQQTVNLEGYSDPDQSSILVSSVPENSLASTESYSEEDSGYNTAEYSDVSPDSIITLETLQKEGGQGYTGDVFVNIRSSFNYNSNREQPQQQEQVLSQQGYGALQPEDVVTGTYLQNNPDLSADNDNQIGYSVADSQTDNQEALTYYDVQYPEASQYQEEVYRPNEIDEERKVTDVVEIPQDVPVDSIESDDNVNLLNDNSVFVYYPEQNEILTTDQSFKATDEEIQAYFTESTEAPLLSKEPDQTEQQENQLDDLNEIELGTTLPTYQPETTTASEETTTVAPTTETTEKSHKRAFRRRRPFLNLPTRRPYFSSFYSRRRKNRKSTTTEQPESSPIATTIAATTSYQEDETPEEQTVTQTTESAEGANDSQLNAVKSRLEEIKNRRRRPIPFGAKLRPKLSQKNDKEE